MKENNKFVNEDTYQTLTEIKTENNPYDKAIVPLWKKEKKEWKLRHTANKDGTDD